MNTKIALGMIFSLLVGYSICGQDASANPRVHHRVNHRQARQQARMGQGIANGSLTKKETAKLSVQQQRLAAQEQRMRASGAGLTAKEHCRLEKQQDQLSQNIYQQKHDEQER